MADRRLGRRELSTREWNFEQAAVADGVLTLGPSGELLNGAPLVSDAHLRRAVGALFARAQAEIDSGAVNVVILAARRLVCLYELLVKHGMPPLHGCEVVSDRYLDTSPAFSAQGTAGGVRVLVLDDSVVLGTTLRRLYNQLSNLIGSDGTISYRAACVDVDQVALFLFDGLDFEAILQRSSAEVQQFSADVVTALFAHQVPFFADFPVGRAIELSIGEWTDFVTSCPWSVADVTAPGFEQIGRAVALVPSDEALCSFFSRTIPEVASLIDAIKLRFYIRHVQDEMLLVVPVPIVVVSPTSIEALNRALSAIHSAPNGDNMLRLRWEGWQPEAKHRFVQMYGSICVMTHVWPYLGITPTVNDLEPVPIELYFGAQSSAVLEKFEQVVAQYTNTTDDTYMVPARVSNQQPQPNDLLLDTDVQQLLWASQELLAGLEIPNEPPQNTELTKIGTIVSHAVAGLFGHVNEHKEAVQRREIKSLGSLEAYEDWLASGAIRVLEQGFTLSELTDSLLPDSIGGSAWARSLLSLGIDEGNDLGIIVPITRYDSVRDLAYRSYRLGETAGLAATPLLNLAYTSADESLHDQFVAAMMARSVPAFPTKASITDAFSLGPVPYPPEAFADPIAYTRNTLKGVPTARFEGTVIEIAPDRTTFLADLVSPSGDEQRIIEFPIDRMPERAQEGLELGTPLRWTIFVRDTTNGTGRDRTSSLHVVTVPSVDIEQLERDASSLPLEPTKGDAATG